MYARAIMPYIMHQRARWMQRQSSLQKYGSIPAYGPRVIFTHFKLQHLFPEVHGAVYRKTIDLLFVELFDQHINIWFKILPCPCPGSPAPTGGNAVEKGF